mgnify:CR=1 FL=1
MCRFICIDSIDDDYDDQITIDDGCNNIRKNGKEQKEIKKMIKSILYYSKL